MINAFITSGVRQGVVLCSSQVAVRTLVDEAKQWPNTVSGSMRNGTIMFDDGRKLRLVVYSRDNDYWKLHGWAPQLFVGLRGTSVQTAVKYLTLNACRCAFILCGC